MPLDVEWWYFDWYHVCGYQMYPRERVSELIFARQLRQRHYRLPPRSNPICRSDEAVFGAVLPPEQDTVWLSVAPQPDLFDGSPSIQVSNRRVLRRMPAIKVS